MACCSACEETAEGAKIIKKLFAKNTLVVARKTCYRSESEYRVCDLKTISLTRGGARRDRGVERSVVLDYVTIDSIIRAKLLAHGPKPPRSCGAKLTKVAASKLKSTGRRILSHTDILGVSPRISSPFS